MTPREGDFNDLDLDRFLMKLVRLEYAMKKHFVYIDNIDDLRHNERVIRDFDDAIFAVESMIQKIKVFRRRL